MQSNLVHLICAHLSRNLDDAIILNEFSVKDLVEVKGTTYLARDLTQDKVKNAAKIYVPIATDHHYSLVIVSHTLRKKFILDSWGGEHKKEARDVLTNPELYLSNTHGMDISGYEEETPAVEHQINNYDCGFHVLLYIKGFDKMDIYNITRDKVLEFRIDLSMELLDEYQPSRHGADAHAETSYDLLDDSLNREEAVDEDNVVTRDEHQGDGPQSSRHETGTSRNSTSASMAESDKAKADESEPDEEEEEEKGKEDAREVGDGHVGKSSPITATKTPPVARCRACVFTIFDFAC
ncbi:uncharacterized protein LOC123440750 isoform X1 [Hordeum vulgare subsp. vulgare]|uniref:uncharacterized protein LOC123440750 isoform X1 n=1 Tax=Hordeum vulgare subsp. vulgare TaxID=112509 RepID=UPI001D1A56B5|nr:uncharacterized protein LOC123440750 isoform X1 [Hordeum vulgare subsp. vulgare]